MQDGANVLSTRDKTNPVPCLYSLVRVGCVLSVCECVLVKVSQINLLSGHVRSVCCFQQSARNLENDVSYPFSLTTKA